MYLKLAYVQINYILSVINKIYEKYKRKIWDNIMNKKENKLTKYLKNIFGHTTIKQRVIQ